jgi:hypothetical protein
LSRIVSLSWAFGVAPFGSILAFSGVHRRSRVGNKIFAAAPTLGKDKARITGHCGNVGSHYQARLRGLKGGFAAEPVSDGGNASPERALRWYRSSYEG